MEGNAVFMLVCILTLWMCPSVLGVRKTGILHEPITLPCSLFCNGLITWKLEDTGTVIKCKNGSCETETGFENRFSISNEVLDGKRSCHLTISSLKYNDQGDYSCNCDGHLCGDYKLVVSVPFDVDVSIGNNVSLPCHAAIKKNIEYETVSMSWEKYGEEKWVEVLRLEKGHFTFTYGPMEDRMSLPEDGYKNGDIPLRITDVRLSDEGVYRCRYSPTRDAGVPGSVRLIVKVSQSDQGLYHCHYSEFGETDKFKGAPNSIRLEVQVGETLKWTWRDSLLLLLVVGVVVSGVIGVWKKYQSQCPCTTGARLPTQRQGEAPVHGDEAAAHQDHVEQLSLSQMETGTPSPHPWDEESNHGDEIP